MPRKRAHGENLAKKKFRVLRVVFSVAAFGAPPREIPLVNIPNTLLEQIRINAQQYYPNECCGLLLGTSGSIVEIRAAANVSSESQRRRYMISPLDLLEAETRARGAGLEVVGIYHSHPDHSALPSQYDHDHAVPHFLYLIVSVMGGRAGEVACWKLPGPDSEYLQEELTAV